MIPAISGGMIVVTVSLQLQVPLRSIDAPWRLARAALENVSPDGAVGALTSDRQAPTERVARSVSKALGRNH